MQVGGERLWADDLWRPANGLRPALGCLDYQEQGVGDEVVVLDLAV